MITTSAFEVIQCFCLCSRIICILSVFVCVFVCVLSLVQFINTIFLEWFCTSIGIIMSYSQRARVLCSAEFLLTITLFVAHSLSLFHFNVSMGFSLLGRNVCFALTIYIQYPGCIGMCVRLASNTFVYVMISMYNCQQLANTRAEACVLDAVTATPSLYWCVIWIGPFLLSDFRSLSHTHCRSFHLCIWIHSCLTRRSLSCNTEATERLTCFIYETQHVAWF